MSDTMSKTTGLFTNFKDDHLTFFALTYENYEATAECLMDLRKHYPSSRVILRSDGDTNPQLPILAERYRVDFRGEGRLFGIQNGGAIIERMLMLFCERPTSYLLKIDPDTVIHRRFKYLPVRNGLFGTLQTEEESPSIQGGCMGFTREAVEQILQSEMLRDSRLKEPHNFINDSPYFFRMADRANRCGAVAILIDVGERISVGVKITVQARRAHRLAHITVLRKKTSLFLVVVTRAEIMQSGFLVAVMSGELARIVTGTLLASDAPPTVVTITVT